MKHYMRLFKTPFNMIQSGYKTVEVRLNDDKRRKLKPNDRYTSLYCLKRINL
ncbi:hypothetical protein ACFPFV_11800 [Salinicoccus siamensis]|uniref:ASCH domain-containing protein n=1 Tax=Salinicoccus siamensis TaxID=381830 RepID=A0ABV5Z5T5_9STAP